MRINECARSTALAEILDPGRREGRTGEGNLPARHRGAMPPGEGGQESRPSVPEEGADARRRRSGEPLRAHKIHAKEIDLFAGSGIIIAGNKYAFPKDF